jgi:hypothetical protein
MSTKTEIVANYFSLGLDRPQTKTEQQADLIAFQADRQSEAAALAAIPPNELVVLRMFHGDSPSALVKAWAATQAFAAEKAAAQLHAASTEVALVAPEHRYFGTR